MVPSWQLLIETFCRDVAAGRKLSPHDTGVMKLRRAMWIAMCPSRGKVMPMQLGQDIML